MTVVAAVIVTTQLPTPVQPPPDQPAKVALGPAAAASMIIEPWSNSSVQSAPQLMPAGLDVTVPVPVPFFATVSGYWLSVKVAVTICAELSVIVQTPVPVQPPPDQPANVEPTVATAVSVTIVPGM